MNNYQNVDVEKLANIYFEGKVISRNIFLKDGSKDIRIDVGGTIWIQNCLKRTHGNPV